ncbi:squalene synthase HpnC [Scleromatobacter humisilvae]|uniref:Squalene synthase HpnC n=1 Tax=Scleromatobacter humisilvae TaxID=2897159 RepID=A0A9X1YJB4_9BURK|nr:squalene synthase HpnC [Scleromatobacter humisilvae]MCK9687188.1 squalene synthase HpnC [Scleromatobacter humisilvae]
MSVEHYENFPVASWLCPPGLRPAVRAIYWFARTADDIADEGDASAAARQAMLADYRDDLMKAAAGQAGSGRWPGVFDPLARVIAAYRLPLPLLAALLGAFEEDTRHAGYADRAALLQYCSRSANPIGRLLLHLHGLDDPALLRRSDAVCSALQLINFWQDLSVDVPRGRDYVPRSDAAAHATTPADCLRAPHADASRALVRALCAWARELMLEGAPIALAVPGRVGWELRFVVQGGLRILAKIEAMNFASFARRPRLHAADHLLIGVRALTMRPSLPKQTRIA